MEEQKKTTESRIRELADTQEEIRSRLAGERDLFENQRNELQTEQAAFKALRRRTETLHQDIYNRGVRRTEKSMKLEQLVSKIQ